MPSTFKSPYASSFTSALKKGTPCHQVVWNISKRTNTAPNTIYQSLWKAGLCQRQKFNGAWLYWPTFGGLTNSTNWKKSQTQMWQWFVDWAVCSGWCTPNQLNNNKGTQQQFMNFCKKFFNSQFNGAGANPKASTSWKNHGFFGTSYNGVWTNSHSNSYGTKKTTKRGTKTTSRKRTGTSFYSFPKAKSTSRRYRVAA